MDKFIDRIQYFMAQRGINNNQMTIAAGLSVGLIGKAIKLKSGLSSDSIEKILYAYPELNPTWLLTGKGEMLNTPVELDKNATLSADPLPEKQNSEVEKTEENVNSNNKNVHPNVHLNVHLSRKNQNSSSQNKDANISLQQQRGNNEIIMSLIEQLKELSEEIGALRQENAALKHRLAQLVEDVGNVQDVPA